MSASHPAAERPGPDDAAGDVGAGGERIEAPATDLERALTELNDAAARLRADDLDPDEAAALVERCAELAARLGAALEREARAVREEPPGEGTLG